MRWILKLGVAYNTFSGAELLKPAIQCVRPLAGHVVVVYSRHAITGEPAPKHLMPLLNDLKNEGLVDELIECVPRVTQVPLEIQSQKRAKYEVGRLACVKQSCTHFMGRDVDEFFVTAELQAALTVMADKEAVLCPLYDYVKDPTYKARQVNTLHVSAFQKCGLPYAPMKTSVLLDLSRTVNAESFYVVSSEHLVMHHMTGVRYNDDEIKRKYQGHSHFAGNGKGQENRYIEADPKIYSRVLDIFGIQEYWKEEFWRYYI